MITWGAEIFVNLVYKKGIVTIRVCRFTSFNLAKFIKVASIKSFRQIHI